MIRVGLDIHTVGRGATGNETYTEGLLEAFSTERPRDIAFTYYHSGSNFAQVWPGSYRHLRPHAPSLRIPFATPTALFLDRIDVAHFQYFLPPVSPCPAVLTIHDISFEHHSEFFSPGMTRRLRWLLPRMAQKAAHIVTVSEATRDDIVTCYGLSPEKISVIYNGVSDRFRRRPEQSELRKHIVRFDLPRPFIVCVGNIGPRKNQERLVRCFSRLLRSDNFPFDLVLVGKPVHRAESVLAEIENCGHGDRIHTTGFVTQGELVALYGLAEFSVYPSLHEGFGLPILESMACGTPVIASNISCMPEIAGGAALLVNPYDDDALTDAILQMTSDTVLRDQLVNCGLKRQAEFSWDIAGQRTLDIYRQVAG